ncbi:reverse transcriptase domain-containing protein [Tanacetum coccineum]|uniref:Reverse transcriptase domain-containing protein n=1 Tax=Tanacetum coccineum TaxID=301880 RepID=A0ABQ4Y485_9ASTR
MVPATTHLIGFSGETIWPLGQIALLVKIADMTGVPRNIAEHRLNIREGYSPVRQKKRGQAPKRNKVIQEEVEKLVDARIMKEVHYHCVTSPTPDCYPLPKIDWKVESLCGYPFKCFLDAYKGYHQIKMAKEDEEKTAFITSQGIFCYSKMSFGLKNVGSTYQRLVDKAFQRQIGRNLEKNPVFSKLEIDAQKERFSMDTGSRRGLQANEIENLLQSSNTDRTNGDHGGINHYLAEQKKSSLARTWQKENHSEVKRRPERYVGSGQVYMINEHPIQEVLFWGTHGSGAFGTTPSKLRLEKIHGGVVHHATPRQIDLVCCKVIDRIFTGNNAYGCTELINGMQWTWGIDIAGPFPEGPGKVKFLIVAIDYFTKWIEAKAVATITGNQVKKFVWDNIVCRFGLPGEIISDNGKQFRDNPFKDWCEKLCIRQCFASVKHPQANGLVERANRSLGEGIKARLDERSKDWIEELSHGTPYNDQVK